jgi:hypothetical protein
MSGMHWPDEFSAFKDIADKYYSDADESVLHASAEAHKKGLAALRSALEEADQAYAELMDAFELDGKQSDAYAAVRERRQEFRQKGGTLAAKALAGQQFMEAAASPVQNSKSKDQEAGHAALRTMQKTQFWPDWMLHRAGKETHLEQARKQLEDNMAKNKDVRVQALRGSYKPPADGDYDFGGQPTSWSSGPVSTQTGFEAAGVRNGPVSSKNTFDHAAERRQSTSSQTGFQQIAERNQAATSAENYGRAGMRSDGSPSGTQASAGAVPGGGQGSNSDSGNSGAGASPGSASTGLQSGTAVTERRAPASLPSASAGGGGVGPAPSIGSIGAAPRGDASQPGRIVSVGGAGGGDAPRTTAQGSVATEKPTASPSSSGSGSQQGSGLSRSSGSAGAAPGTTQAQSAQHAALRDALRTGDAAAGAGRAADRVAGHGDMLGTGRATELSHTALQAAHGQTAALSSALGSLEYALAQAHPASGAGELAALIANGGVVRDAGRAGFLADGVTWGRVPQPPFRHVPLGALGFLFHDMRVAPNEEVGVFRPVSARATTTGWLGEFDPAMRLPEGTRILDRSQAPADTDHITDPGVLACRLARWLLAEGLDGDRSWRLVAVCFLEEPDAEAVRALATMPHPVESYWPGRCGYELGAAPQQAVQDARLLSAEELQCKQAEPLQHAHDLARLNPDGLYDPTGLPPKEAAWYRESTDRAGRPQLTNARWKQELDQYHREERGSSALQW